MPIERNFLVWGVSGARNWPAVDWFYNIKEFA